MIVAVFMVLSSNSEVRCYFSFSNFYCHGGKFMHCQNQIYSKERIYRYNLQGLFAKLKIIHRLSCLGTPEQNGITERKLRHIVKISLTLLSHSSLDSSF